LQSFLFFGVVLGHEGPALLDGFVPELLLFDVVTLALLVAAGEVDPGVKRDVVVHLKQEGVNRLTVSDHLAEELLVDLLFEGHVLLLNCDLVDSVLGLQFQNLHFPVQTEVSVLPPHAPVQQLVEINVTVVAANAHFEHHLLHLVVGRVERQSQRHRQLPEEVVKFLFAQFKTPVARLREENPRHHEDI
jgi:hypothetical protein